MPALDVEQGAESLIADATDEPAASGLRVANSTNWWHTVLTLELCRAWRIQGLEFLAGRVGVLSPEEAAGAVSAVRALVAHLRADAIPLLSRQMGPELAALEAADRAAAADAAEPVHEVDEASGDVDSFFQWLATLAQAAGEAVKSGRHLLFYAPQP